MYRKFCQSLNKINKVHRNISVSQKIEGLVTCQGQNSQNNNNCFRRSHVRALKHYVGISNNFKDLDLQPVSEFFTFMQKSRYRKKQTKSYFYATSQKENYIATQNKCSTVPYKIYILVIYQQKDTYFSNTLSSNYTYCDFHKVKSNDIKMLLLRNKSRIKNI